MFLGKLIGPIISFVHLLSVKDYPAAVALGQRMDLDGFLDRRRLRSARG